MPEENEVIFRFIVDSLKNAGSSYNIINQELVMAQCLVDIPRTFFRAARTETLNLQMVCQPDILSKYPGSELVTRGSFRLQWFIDGVKERGTITKGTFAYELDPRKTEREIAALMPKTARFFFRQPSLWYQPHLLVNFKVSLETDEKFEELYNLSINLVNGSIASNLMEVLAGKKISTAPPKKNLEKRKIPYSEGFNALLNHLKWILQTHDPEWIKDAQLRWEEEVKYLEAFYRGNSDETLDEQSFYRRMAEVYRKYQPVIRIHIVNAALLFLPTVIYTLEPLDEDAILPPVHYDPLHRRVQWPLLTPGSQNDRE
jgi:hypothetical protein